MSTARKTRTAAAALAMTAGLAIAPAVALGGPADPPGNNGTIKIDARAFDDDPDNQPHVACRFQVDFYGYDAGVGNAAVTFSVHPPTGDAVILTDSIDIGEDAAGGGTDLDADRTYNLVPLLRGIYAPHPKQGWHVKVEVNAPGSIGDDSKYKVFWLQSCEADPGNGGGEG